MIGKHFKMQKWRLCFWFQVLSESIYTLKIGSTKEKTRLNETTIT